MTDQTPVPAPSMRRFAGKVAIVTGAARGIGLATATRFASEGANVVLVDLPDSPLTDAALAVERAGGVAHVVAADVAHWREVEGYATAAVDRFGGIDYLFNNAGIEGYIGSLLDYPEEVFDRLMAVNVKGVWLGIKAVAPHMRARGGGAIVNTASVAGLRGAPRIIAYSASKHAVIGITKTAAKELASDGIRVNAVCPSPIETRMMRSLEQARNPADPEAVRRANAANHPLGRYGEPEEVAAVVAFLCSADASFLTGGAYTVDGGWSA